MNAVKDLKVVNVICGAVLMVSGTITAYADTLGTTAGRWVSIVLGGFGVAQMLSAALIQEIGKQMAARTAVLSKTGPTATLNVSAAGSSCGCSAVHAGRASKKNS